LAALREVWEVRRGGELIWGDALHLEGDVARIVDDPACFASAAAFATMILSPAGQNPRMFLDCARAVQSAGATVGLRAGVTAIEDLVVARWLAADASLLRRAYAGLACHFRSRALGLAPRLPRIWHV
jgi:urease accessory protein